MGVGAPCPRRAEGDVGKPRTGEGSVGSSLDRIEGRRPWPWEPGIRRGEVMEPGEEIMEKEGEVSLSDHFCM